VCSSDLNWEMTGVPVFEGVDNKTLREIAPQDEITSPVISTPPRASRGLLYKMRTEAGDFTPVLTQIEINFNNTVAPRATITDAEIGASGYMATRITDRAPTITIDPEHVLPAAGFDFVKQVTEGGLFGLVIQSGSAGDANGMVIVHAPTVQANDDYSHGDRDGITTSDMTLGCYGTDDDELVIYHVFIPAQ